MAAAKQSLHCSSQCHLHSNLMLTESWRQRLSRQAELYVTDVNTAKIDNITGLLTVNPVAADVCYAHCKKLLQHLT